MDSLRIRCLRSLEKWLPFALGRIHCPTKRPDVAASGLGDHGHWSVQTDATIFAALAVLASDPEFDAEHAGTTRAKLSENALKIFRFIIRTHFANGEPRLDGESWGRTWISPLALERMAHGVDAISEFLTDDDRKEFQNVIIDDASWRLDNMPVQAGLEAKDNKPESNIWHACQLLRAVMLRPDAPRAAEYLDKAMRFIANGISTPADKENVELLGGRQVKDLFVGPNFDSDYSLNHHAYLNVGYMVICLSNIAMLHFAYRERGLAAPESLYWHVPELWRLIKLCTFPDGRLLRIGGDTRVRYCYCQDYALPMWLLMRDKFGEDVDAFVEGWLAQVFKEQGSNADGSFLGGRLTELEEASPVYRLRLEGDRAATLSMTAYWLRKFATSFKAEAAKSQIPLYGSWSGKYHGALLSKGARRTASFVWDSAQRPSGLCVPTEASDMAEWRWNLVGEIRGMGVLDLAEPVKFDCAGFPGGFRTAGRIAWRSAGQIAEGQADETTAIEEIAVFALPDDASMLVLQRAKTVNRVYLKSVKGLFLNIPNDIFNNCKRLYSFGNREKTLQGFGSEAESMDLKSSEMEVDGALSVKAVYGMDFLKLNRPGRRQVEIFNKWNSPAHGRSGGNLYCDEICSPCVVERRAYDAGALLFDHAFSVNVQPENHIEVETLSANGGDLKALRVKAVDGKSYVLAVNFGDATACFEAAGLSLELAPLETHFHCV